MNKIITVDIKDNKYPVFLLKETEGLPAKDWIECEVEVAKEEVWEGRVITISSSGKYKVELLKKID